MELYFFIYTSVPAKPMTDNQLQELLNISRKANTQFDITGMLVCLPESFTQLIEGPRAHVLQLYKNIQKDNRHFRVTTLREGSIKQRFFPDWAMAFKTQGTGDYYEEVLTLEDEKVLQFFDIIEY